MRQRHGCLRSKRLGVIGYDGATRRSRRDQVAGGIELGAVVRVDRAAPDPRTTHPTSRTRTTDIVTSAAPNAAQVSSDGVRHAAANKVITVSYVVVASDDGGIRAEGAVERAASDQSVRADGHVAGAAGDRGVRPVRRVAVCSPDGGRTAADAVSNTATDRAKVGVDDIVAAAGDGGLRASCAVVHANAKTLTLDNGGGRNGKGRAGSLGIKGSRRCRHALAWRQRGERAAAIGPHGNLQPRRL